MNEYRVHYKDKETKKNSIFYFVDYANLEMLLRDLDALHFESEYGEVLGVEKVVFDETAPAAVPA